MQSYYTMDIEKIPAGQGSGFVWDRKGKGLSAGSLANICWV
jgi:hypothetical protein